MSSMLQFRVVYNLESKEFYPQFLYNGDGAFEEWKYFCRLHNVNKPQHTDSLEKAVAFIEKYKSDPSESWNDDL